MDPWLTLAFAGLFEVGFTTCLKLEERSKVSMSTRLGPTVAA